MKQKLRLCAGNNAVGNQGVKLIMSLFLGQHLKVFCSVIRRYLSAMEHSVGTGFFII